MLHSVSHAANELQWIERMSGPLLVDKNILVDRSRHDNVRLWSRIDDKRMRYTGNVKIIFEQNEGRYKNYFIQML